MTSAVFWDSGPVVTQSVAKTVATIGRASIDLPP